MPSFNSLYEIPKRRYSNSQSGYKELSILFMRFLEQRKVQTFKFKTFNSLYEIQSELKVMLCSALFPFNSLYEILCKAKRFHRLYLLTFNSLYEILLAYGTNENQMDLSILFMRFNIRIDDNEIVIKHFQFSLWDSRRQIQVFQVPWLGFQFSLWDSTISLISPALIFSSFQFSLWDSFVKLAVKWQLIAGLSILFMRFTI